MVNVVLLNIPRPVL